MIRQLVSFKRNHPRAWAVVESVNGALFRLRYGRLERVAAPVLDGYSVAGCRFSLMEGQDLPRLGGFLSRLDGPYLKWFRPHDFDEATLERLFRNPAFLMMKVTGPDGGLRGYFFLRSFFIGRAFAGLVVDPDWQNQGIGSHIWEAQAEICSRLGLRMQATVSVENKPSLASCRRGTSVRDYKELEDGYLAIECESKINSVEYEKVV